MTQNPNQNTRLGQLEHDNAFLCRAVARLLNVPGHHGRWTTEDFAALNAMLDRLDPLPEPERVDEPYVDPTDWEAQEQPHDDLSGPARMA